MHRLSWCTSVFKFLFLSYGEGVFTGGRVGEGYMLLILTLNRGGYWNRYMRCASLIGQIGTFNKDDEIYTNY